MHSTLVVSTSTRRGRSDGDGAYLKAFSSLVFGFVFAAPSMVGMGGIALGRPLSSCAVNRHLSWPNSSLCFFFPFSPATLCPFNIAISPTCLCCRWLCVPWHSTAQNLLPIDVLLLVPQENTTRKKITRDWASCIKPTTHEPIRLVRHRLVDMNSQVLPLGDENDYLPTSVAFSCERTKLNHHRINSSDTFCRTHTLAHLCVLCLRTCLVPNHPCACVESSPALHHADCTP